MTSLRQTYSGDNKKDNDPKESNSNNETFISILDGGGAGDSKGKLYSAALQAILKGLVMWIIGEYKRLFYYPNGSNTSINTKGTTLPITCSNEFCIG